MEAAFKFSGFSITVAPTGSLVFLDIEELSGGGVASPDHPADPTKSTRMIVGLTKSAARSVASAMMGAAADL